MLGENREAHGKFAESEHMPCPSESALLFIVFSFSLFREHSLGYRKQFQFEKFKYPSLGSGSGGGEGGGRDVYAREIGRRWNGTKAVAKENGRQEIGEERERKRSGRSTGAL